MLFQINNFFLFFSELPQELIKIIRILHLKLIFYEPSFQHIHQLAKLVKNYNLL